MSIDPQPQGCFCEAIGEHAGVVHLTDDRGNAVPCQVTALEHDGAYYLLHLCFLADLPALGYRCYHLTFPEDAPTWNPPAPRAISEIENEHLRLGFDPALGSGPICTIVQDSASLALYFMLVTLLVP